MGDDEILAAAAEADAAGCTELHIVGGLHPGEAVRLVPGHHLAGCTRPSRDCT